MNGESQPARPAGIPTAVDELQKAILTLHDLTIALKTRLDPVMNEEDHVNAEAINIPHPPRSPLEERLKTLTESVETIKDTTESILRRLEI